LGIIILVLIENGSEQKEKNMIDEVLYMEARVFIEFLRKFKMKAKEANRIFESYGIWKYIEECYDLLHMSGDEYVLNDIVKILKYKGARI